MEASESGGGSRKVARKKMAIEDYLNFIDGRTLPLTVGQFRQIIGMHGCKKIVVQKYILTEMVAAMELMDFHRSTLFDDGVSGDASLILKEVINDLELLQWRECCVTSLLACGAGGSPPSAAVSGAVDHGESENSEGEEEDCKTGLDQMGEREDDSIGPERPKRQRKKPTQLLR